MEYSCEKRKSFTGSFDILTFQKWTSIASGCQEILILHQYKPFQHYIYKSNYIYIFLN